METINIITGLDVGTTKIGCLIAEVSSSGEINIKGVGTAPSEGLRYGMVVDIEKTVRSIRKAVEAAEAMAGVAVDLVYAGIAGDHIRDINGRGVVAISGENHEVSADDVRRVIEAARAVALPMDREMIHILPQEFIVDQQRGIRDPVGMCGVRLEAEVHIVTGAVASAQNIYRCIEKAGYTTADLVLESLASSYSVLTDDAKEMGVILIDIGGGTSETAVISLGGIVALEAVRVGSFDIDAAIQSYVRRARRPQRDQRHRHRIAHAHRGRGKTETGARQRDPRRRRQGAAGRSAGYERSIHSPDLPGPVDRHHSGAHERDPHPYL